ncbi:DNA-directed DNA/RNA polymerase mu-like [Babylonia areolata]|uniref:DNA-directed DNA/RNA polymerase mu-like n=1 Tax=Babylonia areolata TaxID=304850 RepID=UPI003FD0E099
MAAAQPADNSESSDGIIYIMPQRIQKSMLRDINNGVKRTNLRICEKYREEVSHIVTQYTEREQVVRQLKRDGADVPDDGSFDRVKVVTLAWLSACLKAGRMVDVEKKHVVKCSSSTMTQKTQETTQALASDQGRASQTGVALWACQRSTPLNHFNHKFTNALEILEQHAEFRNGDSDYSRALAFRRASCVLKSLPYRVQRLSQVEGLKDVGEHALKVIQSILEEGVSEEVQQITNEWFLLMKEFTSVFGVGPATAKKWIDRGWKSIDDVRESGHYGKDERVHWGLAFHEDLTSPVSMREADRFLQIVKTEAEKILPGVVVTLTGGFRRGKQSGHDVDILLTHPREGEEAGLLAALLQALVRQGLVLMGRLEASTFTPDCLTSDSKLLALRGQLDHFEKWLGICRFESATESTGGHSDDVSTATEKCEKESETVAGGLNTGMSSKGPEPLCGDKGSAGSGEGSRLHQNDTQDLNQKHPSNICSQTAHKQGFEPTGKCTNKHKLEPCEGNVCEPKPKQLKNRDKHQCPFELAGSERTWKARRVDLIVCPYSQYYYALVGWTGNKHFNRDLRLYAQKELHMKLTSHGLWDLEKQRAVPASSEAEVFDNLKLVYREPSERNC